MPASKIQLIRRGWRLFSAVQRFALFLHRGQQLFHAKSAETREFRGKRNRTSAERCPFIVKKSAFRRSTIGPNSYFEGFASVARSCLTSSVFSSAGFNFTAAAS